MLQCYIVRKGNTIYATAGGKPPARFAVIVGGCMNVACATQKKAFMRFCVNAKV